MNIIYDNNWFELLKLILKMKHPNGIVSANDITDEKIVIDNNHYIYFVTKNCYHQGKICAQIIEHATSKPTLNVFTSTNTQIVAIQSCPQHSFSIPIAISSYINNKYKHLY